MAERDKQLASLREELCRVARRFAELNWPDELRRKQPILEISLWDGECNCDSVVLHDFGRGRRAGGVP